MSSTAKRSPSFPITGVTCGSCGRDDCVMYPDQERNAKATYNPTAHRPTTICPSCSTPADESLLRFLCHRDGLKLGPASVFGAIRPAPVAEMQAKLDAADDEDIVATLEECWQASEDGSDYTSDFERGEDGRLIFYDDGPRPSHALALLFDLERHMRGESTALVWGEAT